MRIQFYMNGYTEILSKGRAPNPKAFAVAEVDMGAVRKLFSKARSNVSGTAKSGPVRVELLEDVKKFRVTYTPNSSRTADRGVETIEVEAFNEFGATVKAQNELLKKFRGDGGSVVRMELDAVEIQ